MLTHHPGMTENGLLRFIWKATWRDVNHFTAADMVGVHRAIGKHFLLRLWEPFPVLDVLVRFWGPDSLL